MAGAGEVILRAIRHRVSRAATTFAGREVQVYVNDSGPGSSDPSGMAPEQMWRTQPHLRTVVDFLARNIAQLGLHTFTTTPDGQRERDRNSPVADVLARPNPYMTTFELVYDLVGNHALHNRAYWWVHPGLDGRMRIDPFPAHWVTPVWGGLGAVESYTVSLPEAPEKTISVDSDQMVAFAGWAPEWGAESSSPIETLRLILEEQYHSRRHRVQVWRRNGRVGSYITRPKDAPGWDDTARARFYEMFQAFVGDTGPRAGGSPLLEDGMELKRIGFNASDEEWAESVKLSLRTVAQVYQVNPTMVGDLDQANYSNVREFNRSLYTNTLGPLLRFIEARVNTFVLPLLAAQDGQFVEFNVEEKMRGSFEEQASIMSTSIGGPWLTRNEGRARLNMPPLPGGDELITPLNVTAGGQASPQDGGDGRPPESGDSPEQEQEGKAREVIAAHVQRWGRIYPAKGFDMARADRELTADLEEAGCSAELAHEVNTRLKAAMEEHGPVVDVEVVQP